MSGMNGNPHADDAAGYVTEASSLHDWPNTERTIIAANAQALATLSLAYEQRTANIIAAAALVIAKDGISVNLHSEFAQIDARLGLGSPTSTN